MTDTSDISVPLLDLKAQFRGLKESVMQTIEEVCDSQRFVMGPKVVELEEQIAEYSGCRFGVGVSSGTDALLVALMALKIGPGDAVITTPYTFFATAGTIARVGARPLFCDIEPDTYNLSADQVLKFIEDECEEKSGALIHRKSGDTIKAMMPVHLYGQTVDMAAFASISERFNLPVIEDAAQSIGSEYSNGKRAGSAGAIGCFSFFPSKNLGAFGDGGMCVTNDAELAKRMGILRLHGGNPKYYHAVIGGNFRLDALQAAVLLVKLKELDNWTAGRQENARYYDSAFNAAGLGDRLGLPSLRTGHRHIYNQYVVRAPRRDELRKFLGENNIGTEIYYPVPLHLQECFASLGYQEGDFPDSEMAANETLALPVYPELSDEQQDYVVSCVAEFYS